HRSAPGIGIVQATVSCETTGQRLDQYSQCESFIARVNSTERQHRSRWILNEFSRVVGCVSTTIQQPGMWKFLSFLQRAQDKSVGRRRHADIKYYGLPFCGNSPG